MYGGALNPQGNRAVWGTASPPLGDSIVEGSAFCPSTFSHLSACATFVFSKRTLISQVDITLQSEGVVKLVWNQSFENNRL